MAKLEESGFYSVPPPPTSKHLDSLCYDGWIDSDSELPDITVAFYLPGIIMDLNSETLFYQSVNGLFCMGTVEGNHHNIIGAINQQFSNIGYDLDDMTKSCMNADCDLHV